MMVSQLSTIGSDNSMHVDHRRGIILFITKARQIFRDLIDMPAEVTITEREIEVRFHRRTH